MSVGARVRRWAGMVAVALAVPLTAGAPPIGAQSAPAPTADPPVDVPAVPAGTELADMRTADSKTFATDEAGTMRTEVYAAPVHYQESGEWVEIDPSLETRPAAQGGGYRSEGTPVTATIAPTADAEVLARVALGGGTSIGFGLEDGGDVPVEKESDLAVTFEDVVPDVDLTLETLPGGVKETIVIHDADAPRTYDFPLDLRGLTAELVNGSVHLRNDAGEVVGRIPAGSMEDSSSHPVTGVPAQSMDVAYELLDPATNPVLRVTVDDDWMDDPSRVYPVLVDPSVLQANGAADDTYVMAYSPGDRSALTQLQVGNNGFLGTRSFIHFPGLDALAGQTINAAVLKLYQNGTGSCTSSWLDVHRVTAAWTGATTTTWGGPAQEASPIGSIRAAAGGTGCAAKWLEVPFTDAVQGWAAGTIANNGVALRARNEGAAADYKRFGSAESWAPPHVQVVWSAPVADSPLVPTNITPAGTTNSTAPILAADYVDPQGEPGAVSFIVRDSEGQVAASGAGTIVSSGERSSFQVPADVLALGGTYQTTAFAVDEGELSSPNAAPVTFTVPQVSVDAITPGGTVFHTEQVTIETSITSGITRAELLVDGVVTGQDTSPPYVVPWDTTTSTDGPHSLVARLVRPSGNVSAPDLSVEVANTLTAAERLDTDLTRGRIDDDAYTLEGVRTVLQTSDAPARYTSGGLGDHAATGGLLHYLMTPGAISTATETAVRAILEPADRFPDPPAELDDEMSAMAEDDYPACDDKNYVLVGTRTANYCVETDAGIGTNDPDLSFYFTVGDDKGVDDVDTDSNGIPDDVDAARDNIRLAIQEYQDLGFQLSQDVIDNGLQVGFDDRRAFANPFQGAWNEIVLGQGDYVSTARHEMFHVFQYNYLSEADVLGEYCLSTACRDTTLWWLEATAEWADHQVIEGANLTSADEEPDDYFFSLPEFLDHADEKMVHYGVDDSRAYGAFIFTEWLDEHFGQGFILDSLQELDEGDGRSGFEVVEDLIEAESETAASIMPRFWTAAYLLTNSTNAGVHGFSSGPVAKWRSRVQDAANSQDYDRLAGDGFSAKARAGRAPTFMLETEAGDSFEGVVGPGGATFQDIQAPEGAYGSVDIDLRVLSPSRHDKFAFSVISYGFERDPGSGDFGEWYPIICGQSGAAGRAASLPESQTQGIGDVIAALDADAYSPVVPDEDGEATITYEATPECPHATLVTTHTDPDSTRRGQEGYEVTIDWEQVSSTVQNGRIALGLNVDGSLINGPIDPYGGVFVGSGVGVRYLGSASEDQGEGVARGCACEGWGVKDLTSGLAGGVTQDSGNNRIVPVSFSSDGEEAEVVVNVVNSSGTPVMQVEHLVHTAVDADDDPVLNLYELQVKVTNLQSTSANVVYRRTTDWDVPVTPFTEYVTLAGSPSWLVGMSNDGFVDPRPGTSLCREVSSCRTSPHVDNAGELPDDVGSAFDMSLGTIPAGQSRTLHTFYGAALSETTALNVLTDVGAQLYALGQSSNDPTGGTPYTFIYGARMGDI